MPSGHVLGTGVFLALVALAAGAGAESDVETQPEEEAPEAPFAPALEAPSRFGLALEAYSGIGTEWTRGAGHAHGLVGGVLRARVAYVQVGGAVEITDAGNDASLHEPTIEHWRSLGGFVGFWLPYDRWLDLEGSVGVCSRSYSNEDPSYGPHGFDRSMPALSLRLGASDRLGARLFGWRVGAEFVGTFDLDREAPTWRHEFLNANGTTEVTTGATPIGGVSFAIVVSVGLEVGGTPRSSAPRD